MSTQTALHPNQLAMFQTPERLHHPNVSTKGRGVRVSTFLRKRIERSNPRGLCRDIPVTTPFPGMEPPAKNKVVAAQAMNRAASRRAHKPIAIDRHVLGDQRLRLSILLRNILPSQKAVFMTREALWLQATYRNCYASADYLAAKAGAEKKTWGRTLALLRKSGLAEVERLVNARTGLRSVNLVDLTELWRLLLWLLQNVSPYLRDGPGCWTARRTRDGGLVIPQIDGCLTFGLPWVLEQIRNGHDFALQHGDDPNAVVVHQKPPSFTQQWFAGWAADMKAKGERLVFPTVRAQAKAVLAANGG